MLMIKKRKNSTEYLCSEVKVYSLLLHFDPNESLCFSRLIFVGSQHDQCRSASSIVLVMPPPPTPSIAKNPLRTLKPPQPQGLTLYPRNMFWTQQHACQSPPGVPSFLLAAGAVFKAQEVHSPSGKSIPALLGCQSISWIIQSSESHPTITALLWVLTLCLPLYPEQLCFRNHIHVIIRNFYPDSADMEAVRQIWNEG